MHSWTVILSGVKPGCISKAALWLQNNTMWDTKVITDTLVRLNHNESIIYYTGDIERCLELADKLTPFEITISSY